jgi:MFS family permease
VSLVDDCRALDRRVFSLALARLVVTAGYSMVMPFLAMHLAVDRKVPVVIVGSILFIAGSLGAVAQWLAGELADRVGRRPLLLGAMWLRALNLGAMGFAVASTAPLSLIVPVIGLLTVANAVLRGFFDPVAGALVADLTTPSQRVAAFSIQRVGVNIGWAAGPAAAAFAAGASYASLFFASVPLTVISAVALSRMKDLPAPAGERRAFTLTELLAFTRDRQLLRFLVTTISFFVLQVQLYQTTSIYAAQVLGLGRREVGTVYTLNGVIVAFLQLPAIYAIKRLSPSRAIVMGSIGYGLAYASVGLVRDAFGLYAAIVAVTLAEIVSSPAQQTAITNLAPPGRVGAYMGLFGLCQAVGQSSGPLVGTTLLAVLPPRAAWFALALFGIGAALGYRGVVFPSQNPGKPLASARQA